MNYKLTICVPTFNRPEKFSHLIGQILTPDILSFSRIIVADNASTIPYDFSMLNNNPAVTFIKRPVNLGSAGNVLRLFEEATTEWIMIIGDDDEIEPGFAGILRAEIEDQPNNIVAVKFSSNLYASDKNVIVSSIDEFVNQVSNPSCFGNTMFVSTWLIRRSRYLEYIRMSYSYAGFHGPHLLPLLFILHNKSGNYLQSTRMPVRWGSSSNDSSWSYGHVYASMLATLPLLPVFQDRTQITTIARSAIGFYDWHHAIRFGLWLIYCVPVNSSRIANYICPIIGIKYLIGFRIAQIIHRFRSKKYISDHFEMGNSSTDRL